MYYVMMMAAVGASFGPVLLSRSTKGCFSDIPYSLYSLSNLSDPFGPVLAQIKRAANQIGLLLSSGRIICFLF